MKLKSLPLTLGICCILLGLLGVLSISTLSRWASAFAEQYFSEDQSLTASSQLRISLSILTMAAIVIIFGFLFIASRKDPTRTSILLTLQEKPSHMNKLAKLKFPRILVVTTGLTLVFVALYVWRIIDPRLDGLYNEGGVVETLTAIAFGSSSLLMVFAINARLQNEKNQENVKKWWLTPYLIIALFFFVIAMEEISWGQAYLGWKTPDAFAEFNRQGETNLHNILESFALLYYPLALLFPLELLSGWMSVRNETSSTLARILPRPSTIFLAALLSALAFVAVGINEFVEQLFALFTIAYSFQMYSGEKSLRP